MGASGAVDARNADGVFYVSDVSTDGYRMIIEFDTLSINGNSNRYVEISVMRVVVVM